MALKQIEILQDGASIAVRPVNTPNTAPFEYYPMVNIKSVTGLFKEDYGTALEYTQQSGSSITRSHPYEDLAQITVYFIDENLTPLRFNLQDVSNQAGWLPTEAGVAQATTDINSWITASTGGGGAVLPPNAATESTLQQVLLAIQDGQDFEVKSVVDATDTTYLEVRIWNSDTQTWETPLYYAPGSNIGVPIGSLTAPVTYLNPQATLSLILTEMQTLNATDFATEATLEAVRVLLTGVATEATLLNTNVILTAIDAVLDNIKLDTARLDVDLSTRASEATLLATNALLTTIDTVLDAIKLDTANLDVPLSTRASEATLAKLVEFGIGEYDHFDVTYVAAGNGVGEPQTIVYRSGGPAGTILATLTIAYDANNRPISVTKS